MTTVQQSGVILLTHSADQALTLASPAPQVVRTVTRKKAHRITMEAVRDNAAFSPSLFF